MSVDSQRYWALMLLEDSVAGTRAALDALLESYKQKNHERWLKIKPTWDDDTIATEEKGKIIMSYEKIHPPFIALYRVLLPEIEFLGQCLDGSSSGSAGAVRFIKKYFSLVNPEYMRKGVLIWAIFRASVIHQGSIIKAFSYKGKKVGVGYAIGAPESHLEFDIENNCMKIDMPTLISDFHKASDLYIEDIQSNDELVMNFDKYFHYLIDQSKNEQLDLEKYRIKNKWIADNDLDILNATTHNLMKD